jgi:transcriptional regulator with XRE-family HTH domain
MVGVYADIDIGYAAAVSAIGKAIQARRKPLMTQAEFARKMGLSQPSVSDWERGESLPPADQLPRIATVLECSVEDLVVGVDDSYDQLRSKRRDLPDHGRDQPSDFRGRKSNGTAAATPTRVQQPPSTVKALKDVARLVVNALTEVGESVPLENATTRNTQPKARRRAGGHR